MLQGNEQFKRGEYDAAIKFYTEGLDMLGGKTSSETAVILKNRAACFLKLGNYQISITFTFTFTFTFFFLAFLLLF